MAHLWLSLHIKQKYEGEYLTSSLNTRGNNAPPLAVSVGNAFLLYSLILLTAQSPQRFSYISFY